MASGWYNKGKFKIGDSTINWASDTIRTLLVTDGYTFNADHNWVSDVSASEVAQNGGTYARVTLANKTVTEDDTNDRCTYDNTADVAHGSAGATQTVHGQVIYRQVGGDDTTPGDDELLFFVDFTNFAANGADITVQYHADGIGYF